MSLLKRMLLRVGTICIVAALTFAALTLSGYINLNPDSADAVSSATGKTYSAEDMSGSFVVLINKNKHTNLQELENWIKFFSFDEDVPLLMEDISCSVAELDKAGFDAAEIYRQRLPENQMTIKKEAGVLMLSKAEYDLFDVIILSAASAEAYNAETLYNKDNVVVISMNKGE